MNSEQQSKQIAEKLKELALSLGAKSVVVMVTVGDDESEYHTLYSGKRLTARGLLENGAETLRKKLDFPIHE